MEKHDSETMTCPACGSETSSDEPFCESCGLRLSGEPEKADFIVPLMEGECEPEREGKLPSMLPSDVFARLDEEYFGSGDGPDGTHEAVLGADGYAWLVDSCLDECLRGGMPGVGRGEVRETLRERKDAELLAIGRRKQRRLFACVAVVAILGAVLVIAGVSGSTSYSTIGRARDFIWPVAAAATAISGSIVATAQTEAKRVESAFERACALLEAEPPVGEDAVE